MNKVIRQSSNSSKSNIISKNWVRESYTSKHLFFIQKHGDESMRRYKMRLIQCFLDWWKNFLCFPDILGETRIKPPEFGDHQTEFGGACIVQTQDSRKNMFFDWIMNKSICEIRPWSTFISHNQPSPEIWFET